MVANNNSKATSTVKPVTAEVTPKVLTKEHRKQLQLDKQNAKLVKVLFGTEGHPILKKGDQWIKDIPARAFYFHQPKKPVKPAEGATEETKNLYEVAVGVRNAWRIVARGNVLQYGIAKATFRYESWKAQFDPKAKAEAYRSKLLAELAKTDEALKAL